MGFSDRQYDGGGGGLGHRNGGGSGFGGGGGRGFFAGQSACKYILIVNCVIFILDGILAGSERGSDFAPFWIGNYNTEQGYYGLQIWRFFTYQFIHGGLGHIFFNMLGLYFFGPLVEQWWGVKELSPTRLRSDI